MEKTIDISKLTSEELAVLLEEKRKQEHDQEMKRREAYESIRAEVVQKIEQRLRSVTCDVQALFDYVVNETQAFKEVMAEYGKLRNSDQLSFTLKELNFKVEVKVNKVKKFDERADIAAARLIEFLQAWIQNSEKGTDDPMYQLAMLLLERNRYGDLDYKSISKLYELEQKFNNPEYSEIMQLFKESNITEGTAMNFYFYERTKLGVWRRIEPSFNRL
jgi:hypothetical protein